MLTDKQARFVDEYLIDCNATQAAIRAGYSVQTARVIGPENLSKPAVWEAVRQRQAANADQFQITKEDVIRGILSAISMAREQQNPATMISGCVQLAKLCGFYEPEAHKVGISSNNAALKCRIRLMSDEDLYSIARTKVQ